MIIKKRRQKANILHGPECQKEGFQQLIISLAN